MAGVVDRFVEWASSCLLDSEDGMSYLRGRGSSRDQWVRHSIGFVAGDFDPDPDEDPGHRSDCQDRTKKHLWCDTCRYRSWSSSWEGNGDDSNKTCHVGRKLVGSVVYPLSSYSGNLVGFQTRSIVEKSFDTFLCTKRPEGFFFGTAANIHGIWSTGEVAIVEGPSDQLVVERLVFPNVLAVTTNAPGASQSRFLRRFARRVYMFLDSDKAGRSGVETIVNRHGSDFDLVDVKYRHPVHKFKDPNDVWRKMGDDAFRTYMTKAMTT